MNAYYRSISNSKKQKNDASQKSIPSLPKIKNYNPNYATVGSKGPNALNNKLAEGSS
jgi:hypothetical protein